MVWALEEKRITKTHFSSSSIYALGSPVYTIRNIDTQEAMENFVFPYKCSFMLIAMTKALLTNKLYKAFEDAWVTTTELKVS